MSECWLTTVSWVTFDPRDLETGFECSNSESLLSATTASVAVPSNRPLNKELAATTAETGGDPIGSASAAFPCSRLAAGVATVFG